MNHALRDDLATVTVLARRELLRFLRQPTRLVGALMQPVVFWLLIGGGLASTFQYATAPGVGYMQYFFPGIVVMMVLFASIFGTITVIEDRHAGFLQSVLVSPGSRTAVVIGKSLGVASVGLVQAALFLGLAPTAGFGFGDIHWAPLVAFLVVGALGLSAFGFALAWLTDSSQGYHAVMSILLLPAWVLSGAMFPPGESGGVLATLLRLNPMSYMVSGVRGALQGDARAVPALSGSVEGDFLWVAASAVCAIAAATYFVHKRR